MRAFLRPFKGSFACDNGMGNRHRAETSEAVVTSTLHPPRRRYGWADGIGAAAVRASALERRNPAFAAPFLKCYFIWTVSALHRSFLRRGLSG